MFESGFGDFFQQMPPIMYIVFCGSVILLVAFIVLMVWERRRKAETAVGAGAANTSPIQGMTVAAASAPPSGSWGGSDGSDLPDLDSLVVNAQPARRPGTARLRLTAGEDVDVAEIMTVYRDLIEGGLIVQIGDKVYRHPPALADSDFKRRLNTTVRDLYTAIGDTSLAPRKTSETSAVEEAGANLPADVPAAVPVPPPPPAPRPAAPPPSTTTAGTVPGDLPKFKMPDVAEPPKRGRRPPSEPIPEINIAASIEAFLQYKISMTPEFMGRSLHVKSATDGGLIIEVDGAFYETVGDVADPSARAFLQSTIEEWQSRQ
jgi:hypothetical protein